MKFVIITIISSLWLLAGCAVQNNHETVTTSLSGQQISDQQFELLLQKVADGWSSNNARAAADCFTLDAVYIEPPDRQLYQGRDELYQFFGGDKGRQDPMSMQWHNFVFDEQKQMGIGEYTFGYKGRLSHGVVMVQVVAGKIRRWREYQYRSQMQWQDFIGTSRF